MQLIQINTEHDDDDFEALSHIVHEMQVIIMMTRILTKLYLLVYKNNLRSRT